MAKASPTYVPLGRPPLFATAEEVLASGKAYLAYCKNNPLMVEKTSVHEGKVLRYPERRERVPSLVGWTTFIGCTETPLRGYVNAGGERGHAVELVLRAIKDEQIVGGSAHVYDKGIASKLAGLHDTSLVITAPTGQTDVAPTVTEPADSPAAYLHPDDTTGTGPLLTHAQWMLAKEGKFLMPTVIDHEP